MNNGSHLNHATLSQTEAQNVDCLRGRFEQAWQAAVAGGPRPRMEDYAAEVPAELRPILLRELIPLELEYRCRHGEEPQAEEYQQRFPKLDPDWLAGQLAQAAPSAAAAEPPTLPPRPDAREAVTLPPEPGAEPRGAGRATVPGYEVLGELGRGGMGVVYHARQTRLGRPVALKMILAGAHASPAELDRFRREAEAIAQLSHPHVVQVYEVGEHDGLPYFSLEFCAGGSLDRKLGGKPLPPHEAARLVEALARAVQAAHEKGVVHRDLKPANVLLTDDGTPKVTDFGLAKRLDAAGVTGSGQVMGTPSYMAPEQAEGKGKAVGPAADVYALGAILYECLTGRPPFRAATPLETIVQVVAEEPVPPRRLQPKTPRDLETICLKCLAKAPGERYLSAAELADDLRRFQEGQPIDARPVGRLERALKWARRHPARAAAAALLVLVLLLGAVGGTVTLLWQEAEGARRQAVEAREQLAGALGREQETNQQLEAAQAKYRQLMYLRAVDLAHREWRDDNLDRAESLLAECPEDLRCWEWHYVRRLCPPDHFILTGHTARVWSMAFLDGDRLASAAEDGAMTVWDLSTRRPAFSQKVHTGAARGIASSPDGRRVATKQPASNNDTVKLWDVATGQEANSLEVPGGRSRSLALSAEGKHLASAWNDGTVTVWDVATGQEFRIPTGRDLSTMALSPDGKRLASHAPGQTVKVWDVATGQQALTMDGHIGVVLSIAFSPDGKRLAGVSFVDQTVRLWDTASGRQVHNLAGHASTVLGVAFSPDGTRLASAAGDGTVWVWDTATGQRTLRRKHGGAVTSMAFSPDGTRLASAANDGTIWVWNTATVEESRTLKRHTGVVWSVTFSPDGKHLASASEDTSVRVWEAATGQEVRTLGGNTGPVRGSLLAGFFGIQRSGNGHTAGVLEVAFSLDGKRLASASGDKTARVWDSATGQQTLTLSHPGEVWGVAFSPDGQRVASASKDKVIRVWDTATGQLAITFEGHTGATRSVAFRPDGKRLASAAEDGTVKVWDAATGREVLTLPGRHPGPFYRVAFSPDGRRLASLAGAEIRVWDPDTGQQLLTIKGHTGSFSGMAFSPDGKRLASASTDQTVRLWDLATGQEALSLTGHTGAVYSVAFSPDGRRLASAPMDGTVKVWEAAGHGGK